MKRILLAANNAVAMFGTTLYVGVLWALHFFWYPGWRKFKVDNYYDQFIPQTTAATRFFTVVVPLMYLALTIMGISERKTGQRWYPLAGIATLSGATAVGQGLIIPINKILAKGISDQDQLDGYFQRWMRYNDIRGVLMTLMWIVLMLFFLVKGEPAKTPGGGQP